MKTSENTHSDQTKWSTETVSKEWSSRTANKNDFQFFIVSGTLQYFFFHIVNSLLDWQITWHQVWYHLTCITSFEQHLPILLIKHEIKNKFKLIRVQYCVQLRQLQLLTRLSQLSHWDRGSSDCKPQWYLMTFHTVYPKKDSYIILRNCIPAIFTLIR